MAKNGKYKWEKGYAARLDVVKTRHKSQRWRWVLVCKGRVADVAPAERYATPGSAWRGGANWCRSMGLDVVVDLGAEG